MIGPPKISMIPRKTQTTVHAEIPCRLFAINANALPMAAIPIPPPISIMEPLTAGVCCAAGDGFGAALVWMAFATLVS